MRNLLLIIMATLILATASGCTAKADAGTEVKSGEVTVIMKNMKFTPPKLTVKQGTRVTFLNKDAVLHDAVQVSVQEFGKAAPGWTSGELMPAQSWSVTLDKPGEYPVICTQAAHFTAGMVATITVVE